MKKLKITLSILLMFWANYSYSITRSNLLQQDTLQVKSSTKANELLVNSKNIQLIAFCEKEIKKLLYQPKTDSLEIARLYQYQGKAHYNQNDYLECVKSDEAGIRYSNDTEDGRLLKGRLYSDKASAESYLHKSRSTFNSTLNAIKYLKSVDDPDYDYLITSYRFLSEQGAYQGNFEEAKMYLRQAERHYKENKRLIDSTTKNLDGNVYRYDIVLLYSKIYQLYKYGRTRKDSLELVESAGKFEEIVSDSNFDVKNNGIYYVTALNHIGDWYASRKPEALTTKKDIETALNYLNKSINLVDKQGYPGINLSTKYNKVKALALSNKLAEAEELITELLETLSETDGRRSYFLAQKGLIKAKQKQKDNSLKLFYDAISKIHSDTIALSHDLKNFKPSNSLGHTKLLLRISEELKRYFPKDFGVVKMTSKLYPLALNQFENSYDKRKFNKVYGTYLRQIVKGILESKRLGYNESLSPEYLLNRYENIQHLIAWQKFNMNRQINMYPQLDSIQSRSYELRNLIAEAKANKERHQMDSLYVELSQTEKYTKETFPNLNLFNTDKFEVRELQQKLSNEQIVLKYIELDDQIAVFTVSKDKVSYTLLPWSKSDADDINEFISLLANKDYNLNLAKAIASKILPQIDKSKTHLIISPDRIFSKLPFEVLNHGQGFLVEDYNISYTSYLGFIKPRISIVEHTRELAIYAPEYSQKEVLIAERGSSSFLEGAQRESELIGKLFKSELYTGKALTKQDFIETASNYKILHLAMHAELDNFESGISRLLFSDDNSDADDLYLEELYGLNLSADMAVLSACNTGIDKANAKSEIESFQRAFTFAGIPATVASLWKVPDKSTEKIMVDFYKNLKKGQNKSEALKNAKLNFVNNNKGTKLEQPYYWAGFVLYGADTPIASKHDNWFWIISISILFLFVFIYSVYKTNKAKSL